MLDRDGGLLRGTLDVLILKALTWGPRHGYAVAEWVKTVTDGQTMPSLSDFENFLREAGFSKSQATAIAGKGLKSLLRSESGSESNTDFLSARAAQIRG